MQKIDIPARDVIAELIRSIIDEVVREHFDAATQEHQLTSRLCGALEAKLRSLQVFDWHVRIVTQEFPDKGSGSAEKPTGIDLYVGVEIDGPDAISKGIFIQSKWNEPNRRSADQRQLVEQCKKMNSRSHASYVWLYGPEGVEVIPASEVVAWPTTRPEALSSRKVSELFKGVLDCFEGDQRFGLPRGEPMREALKAMIAELAVDYGMAIKIGPSSRETIADPRVPDFGGWDEDT